MTFFHNHYTFTNLSLNFFRWAGFRKVTQMQSNSMSLLSKRKVKLGVQIDGWADWAFGVSNVRQHLGEEDDTSDEQKQPWSNDKEFLTARPAL